MTFCSAHVELDRAYYFHYFYVNLVVKVLSKHPKYDPNLDMCVEAKKARDILFHFFGIDV